MFGNLSFKYKLFVTFLAFYLIPLIIISSVGYSLLISLMSRQTVNGYQTVLDNTGMQLDNSLKSLEAYNMNLMQKGWILSLQNSYADSPKRYDPFDIRKFSDELKSFVFVNEIAKDVLVYFPRSDKIISSLSSNLEGIDFFTQNILSGSQVQSLISTDLSSTKYTVLQNTFNYKREMNGILVAYPMSLTKKSDAKEGCIIAYFIANQTIEDILKSNMGGGSFVMQDEKVIAKNGVTDAQIQYLINVSSNDASIKIEIDGKQYYLLSSESKDGQWTYYNLLELSAITNELTIAKWCFICGLIVFSLLGFCCSFYIAIKNYRPLERIIQKLNENARATDPTVILDNKQVQESAIVHNEFSWLDTAVKTLMDKDRNLMVQMEDQRPLLRTTYLIWLLQSEDTKDELAIKTSLRHLDIILDEPLFNVMIIKKLQTPLHGKQIEEIASSHSITLQSSNTQESTVWITNYSFAIMFDEFCIDLENYMNEVPKPCAIAIGNPVEGITSLHLPYKQAGFALNFASINSQNGLILFSGITSLSGGYYYPLDKEASIRNLLKAGEFNKTFEVFAEVAEHNFENKPVSLERMRNFFRNAQSTCIKVADELGMHFEFALHPEQITDIHTLEACEGDMREAYQAICFYVLENRQLPDIVLKEQICNYTEKMLINPGFSLSTVAEEFDLSISYVSKLFKQYMNCNFLDYINRGRIEIAKAMLIEDEKMDICEIAQRVGYENDTTFRRIFKKYEGVAPVQFRLSNKK